MPASANPAWRELVPLCEGLSGRALWVFGYGSLMWDPGFPFIEQQTALLRGYHRSFCVYSLRYRGTPEAPGLVLGLDRGGSCRGIAYRIAEADRDDVLSYLWEREMFTRTYQPRRVTLSLDTTGSIEALTFVVDREHSQYAGKLPTLEIAQLIAAGQGTRGRNRDYLLNTVRHLHELGLSSPPLTHLAAALADVSGESAGESCSPGR